MKSIKKMFQGGFANRSLRRTIPCSSKIHSALRGVALILLLVFPQFVQAQTPTPNWTQLFPTGGPPNSRFSHNAVYDPATNRMTVFGGNEHNTVFIDVWVLSNANGAETAAPTWTQLFPTGGHPVSTGVFRLLNSAVYDPATNRMVVFGGFNGFGLDNDVWVLSNANGLEASTPTWTQLFPTGGPPSSRFKHSAVYHPATNRMVVFGGGQGSSTGDLNDIWVLSNANGVGDSPVWTQLFPTGGPVSARELHSAVYDPATNRMTVFGGVTGGGLANDVWVLSNANGVQATTPTWTQIFPTGGPPAARAAHSAVYDSVANRMTVVDGLCCNFSSFLLDVWVLSNANGVGGTPVWTQLFPTGGLTFGITGHTAIYDPATKRMTMFGGFNGGTWLNDVWVLTGADGISNRAPTAHAGPDQTVECTSSLGASVMLDGTASSDPDNDTLSFEWRDVDNNVIGTAASVNLTRPPGTHTFTLTVSDGNGGSASDTVQVVVQDTTPPTLILSSSSVTLVVPAASATGVAVDVVAASGAAANDLCDPSPGLSHNGPAVFPIGTTSVTITATDDSGNYAQKQFTVQVVYNFGDYQMPIRSDGSSIFRAGRLIPIRFQLTAADGSFITNAVASLAVFRVTNAILGTTEEVTPDAVGNSNSGNLFRFDADTNTYIYTLSTSGYPSGTYILRAGLNDGTAHEVQVSIR